MTVSQVELSTELNVLVRMCQESKSPLAAKVRSRIDAADWEGLVSLEANPDEFTSGSDYFEAACLTSFLRKYPGFDLGYDLHKRAVGSFFETESRCFRTNQKFSPSLLDSSNLGEGAKRLIDATRKELRIMLGPAPGPNELSQARFGPGSTFANKGDLITVADKLSDDYTATSDFPLSMYSAWVVSAWGRYAGRRALPEAFMDNPECGPVQIDENSRHAVREVNFVAGNRFTTTPKDARKHRGICIEPSLNVFFQLGVGAFITERLKRWGWSKKTTPDRHRVFARGGSMFGHIATIDLSSASDTIASNVVRLLLPTDWVDLLVSLRSPKTYVDGKWVLLEKFSSMGNGYTFELETALFWAISRACIRLNGGSSYEVCNLTSVFGDDIIVPTTHAELVAKCLVFFGFSLNTEKTFLSGPFRESCGGDYYRGLDVRPFFLKKVCDEPSKLISLCNGLRRNNMRLSTLKSNVSFDRSWSRAFNALPRPIARCVGPECLGDLVVHHDDWVHKADFRVRNSIRYMKVWKPKGNQLVPWEHYAPSVVVATALYGAGDGDDQSLDQRVARLSNTADRGSIPARNLSGNRPVLGGSYVSGYGFGRVAFS